MIRWLQCAACFAAMLAATVHAHEGTCNNSPPSAATETARQTLERDPRDLDARFQLADALAAASCFDDAVHVLEQGEAVHGRNAKLQARLREARSMLGEQHYFEGLSRAEESAKFSRHLLRCTKLADLQACDEALQQKPDDPDVIIAKGDALAQMKRPTDALTAYRRVQALAPAVAGLEQKIAAASAQRESLLGTCQSGTGEEALQACRAALLRGGADEFEILKRQGILLQAANQRSPALDAYIAAHALQVGDRAVALAIVALSDSTARKDAVTLAARGSALLALNRGADAVSALNQALALSPGLPEVTAQLAQAHRLAKQQARRQAEAAASTATALASAPPPAPRHSNAAPATRSR